METDNNGVTEIPEFSVESLGAAISEGKTKQIFEIPQAPNLVLIRSKDKITAFNAQRQHEIEGKATLSNTTTCKVFQFLQAIGLKTHFRSEYSASEFVAERCAMIPLEWVTRRVATGSFLKRHAGVKEGFRFSPPKLEIFFKDDEAGDPQWSEEMVLESGMTVGGIAIEARHLQLMKLVTVLVFEVLEKAWERHACTLIDMKIEFGINPEGDIVLSDVIDSDSWRLWPSGDKRLQVDKQFYRDLSHVSAEDLNQLKKNFAWVIDKLNDFMIAPKGRCVVLMGSVSDYTHAEKIRHACHALGIPTELRVTSAHKSTQQTLDIVAQYEGDGVPTVFVACAGRSNGLGPVISGNTSFPVINCPPLDDSWTAQDIWSSLRMPTGLGCSTVLSPDAASMSVASVMAMFDHMVWSRVKVKQLCNAIKLAHSDNNIRAENDRQCEKLRHSLSLATEVEEVKPVVNGVEAQ